MTNIDELDEIVKDLLVNIMEVVGDEFAPKQENGSPERRRLLGLLAQTVPLQIEAAQALSAHSNKQILEVLNKLKDGLPEKVDMDKYEGFDDGAHLSIVDEHEDPTGNKNGAQLALLAQFASDSAHNELLSEVSALIQAEVDKL